ncbi:hypothetical protein H4R35_001690 [Dimargaris xerosporica]|nr:hypothetical protein H4R35_001690 [Dimargaris xerosporica]
MLWCAAANSRERGDRVCYNDCHILPETPSTELVPANTAQSSPPETKHQPAPYAQDLNHLPLEIVIQVVRSLALPDIHELFKSRRLSLSHIQRLKPLMLSEPRLVASYLMGFPITTEDQVYSAMNTLKKTRFHDLQPLIAPTYRVNLGIMAHTVSQLRHFTASQAEIAQVFGIGGKRSQIEVQGIQSLIKELEVVDYPLASLSTRQLRTLAPIAYLYTAGNQDIALAIWMQLLSQPDNEYVVSIDQLKAWFAPQWGQELTLLHKHYAFHLQAKRALLPKLFDGLMSAALLKGDMKFVSQVCEAYKPHARHSLLAWHSLIKAVLVGAQSSYPGTDALTEQLSAIQLKSACDCAAAYQLHTAVENLNSTMKGSCNLAHANVATCNLYLNLPLGYSPDQPLANVLTLKSLKRDYIKA